MKKIVFQCQSLVGQFDSLTVQPDGRSDTHLAFTARQAGEVACAVLDAEQAVKLIEVMKEFFGLPAVVSTAPTKWTEG